MKRRSFLEMFGITSAAVAVGAKLPEIKAAESEYPSVEFIEVGEITDLSPAHPNCRCSIRPLEVAYHGPEIKIMKFQSLSSAAKNNNIYDQGEVEISFFCKHEDYRILKECIEGGAPERYEIILEDERLIITAYISELNVQLDSDKGSLAMARFELTELPTSHLR